jgi:hypothetical protein
MAPFSVMFVVVCEWGLGALIGLSSLMFFVYGFYGLIHASMLRFLDSAGIAALIGAVAAGCFYTGSRLWHGRRWAWRVSWGIGALVGLLGWMALREALWPSRPQSADGYFGLVVGPVLLLFALVGLVMLALPQTRRFLASGKAD